MKYFDKDNCRLVFEGDSPHSKNWDKGWSNFDMKSCIESSKNERFVSRTTKKYIAPGDEVRILEGGCGLGNFVYSLEQNGFNSYGVDFAEETVKRVNSLFPELKITTGDVRKLDFPDNYFDGYWSLGVIEHFYDGYEEIVKEMRRTIKRRGFLFVTFPYMSPLRRLKASLGLYEKFSDKTFDRDRFYQFALNTPSVMKVFKENGFSLVEKKPLTGLKGLKDEIEIFKNPLQRIYDGKSFFAKGLSFVLSSMLSPFSGHAILLVFENKKE